MSKIESRVVEAAPDKDANPDTESVPPIVVLVERGATDRQRGGIEVGGTGGGGEKEVVVALVVVEFTGEVFIEVASPVTLVGAVAPPTERVAYCGVVRYN